MNEIQGICGTVIVPAGVFFVQRGEWKMPLIAIGFGGVFMGMESLDRYEDKQREKVIMRVSVGSIVLNLGLSMFKLMAGFLAGSSAMISDGVHSASDVLSTGIVIVGARLAGKEADAEHPYGHDRLECVACILLAVLLGVTGLGIGITGVKTLVGMMGIGADAETLQSSLVTAPKMLALVAAVLSILVKEGMYRHTRTVAKRIESGALLADAWHHRSDALSSVGSFIGIFGAQHGILWLDPFAGVVISVFVIKAAVEIFCDAVGKMTDRACDSLTESRMRDCICEVEGVLGVDLLKTRAFGARMYVDIEISADGEKNLREAHAIAEEVHFMIEREFPLVKHCMVHVNPA